MQAQMLRERAATQGQAARQMKIAASMLHPPSPRCKQPSRGSAAALSPDDATAVIVNRDVGSVRVWLCDIPGKCAIAQLTREVTLGDGSEPWQAVVVPIATPPMSCCAKIKRSHASGTCGPRRFSTPQSPLASAHVDRAQSTGSRAYVTNWTDGTVSELDTATMTVLSTIDLNAALVATGLLGEVTPRPALAHPRSLS